MTKPARVVFIDVSINSINPLDFNVLPSPKNNPQLPTNANPTKPGQPEIIFRNDDVYDGFEIHFELQGDTHGYFFPANEQDACWSERGAACPNVTGVWGVFRPLEVVKSGIPPERRTLRVKNLNPHMGGGKGQGKFMYNLRVTDGGEWKNLDPGGDNTNGSSKFTFDYLTVGTIGAVTGILSALATTAFLKISNMLICPGVPGP